MSLVEK